MPQPRLRHVRPIRVLWLIKGLGPGGAEQLLLLAAGAANHEDFAYRVAFVRPDKTHLVHEFEQAGITPERLGAKSPGRFGWFRDLRRAIREVDIVHTHSPVLAGVARVLARTMRDRPAVVTTEHNQWTSHRRPTRLFNGLTSPLDDYTWAVSDQVRETVWPWRRKHTNVLIHGIDTSAAIPDPQTRPALRAELGIPDDAVVGITVANLRSNKDYPNLLRAAKIALAEEPRLRFIAVGQGPLEEEIKTLHAELGLGEGLQFLGFRRDVAELMGASDMFVMSSAHEGLPVAIMEAFARGLAVVATTVGGVPQALRDGVEGRLIPPGDSEALAVGVLELARDADTRHAMGRAATLRAADYDIRTAVTAQEDVYRMLAQP